MTARMAANLLQNREQHDELGPDAPQVARLSKEVEPQVATEAGLRAAGEEIDADRVFGIGLAVGSRRSSSAPARSARPARARSGW
jgi:hypothetical protein